MISTCYFSLLLCIMVFKTNIFGVLPFQDVILEVRSVTDHRTVWCQKLFSAWLSKVFGKNVGGPENIGEIKRLEHPVS